MMLNVRFLGRMLEMILMFNLICASNFLFVFVVLYSIPMVVCTKQECHLKWEICGN